MPKIKVQFIIDQYRSGIESYTRFTKEVGLWESEKYVFTKYLNKTDKILDLGCGTGRTTFPICKLGYIDIIGVDLTPEMIDSAKELNEYFSLHIAFEVGDATKLKYLDSIFDVVIFSFNGLMSIPKRSNRISAIKEVHRVLKENGTFIFTTHDREMEPEFLKFWEEEKVRWEMGTQNSDLYEFGDLLTQSKNETSEIFIHIPTKEEVKEILEMNNFEVVETFYRNEKFNESEQVKEKSGECRFWVCTKRK